MFSLFLFKTESNPTLLRHIFLMSSIHVNYKARWNRSISCWKWVHSGMSASNSQALQVLPTM